MRYFMTYGNQKFQKTRDLLVNEIVASKCFDKIIVTGPKTIPEDIRELIEPYISSPKGAGFWIWKPIIVKFIFDIMEKDDILFYADAGCVYNPRNRERFEQYINMLTNEKPSLYFQMALPEKSWTSSSIFKHFDIQPDNPIRESGQIVGGIFMLRKNSISQRQVDLLYSTAINHTSLFSDDLNDIDRDPFFVDNRHDQSINSVIVKINQENNNIIPDETYGVGNEIFNCLSPILALRRYIQ